MYKPNRTDPIQLLSGSWMPGIPNGLSMEMPGYSIRSLKAARKVMGASVSPAAQTTGRERGEGGLPSGNSRGVKIMVRPSSGNQYQRLSHAATRNRGSV